MNSQIKKVLFLSSVYKPNVDGVGISIEQIGNYLQKEGIKSSVLTKKFPYNLSSTEIVDGVFVYRFKRPKETVDFERLLDELMTVNHKIKADIIHLIGIRRPMPLIGLLLAKMWKVPFLITFAGGDLPEEKWNGTDKIWNDGIETVPNAVIQADHWTAYSQYTSLIAKNIFPEISKIEVVYGGIDMEKIEKSAPLFLKNPFFFSARKLDVGKGVDILIKAFASISEKLPNHNLFIAGDGEERGSLYDLTKKYKLLDKVFFLGEISQKSVFSYMKGAVAHICPSRAESGGLVNYEAQRCGCLAIGSNAGGIPEYIDDNKTGILFKSEDVNDLAKKLLIASLEEEKMKIIKERALVESKNFNLNNFGKNYYNIYKRIIKSYSFKEFNSWSILTERLKKKINF